MNREWLRVFVSLSALAFWPSTIEGAIHCYCNSGPCAAEGFVCLSQANRCFSKLYNSNKTADVHGCLDQLPVTQKSICDGYRSGDLVKTSETGGGLIMCCLDDLCNYNPNQDVRVDVTKVNANPGNDRTLVRARDYRKPHPADDWFTATVIAVPIAGGLILTVLVLVAVRMLQYDRKKVERQRGVDKARLYIDSHFSSGAHCLQMSRPQHIMRSTDNVMTQTDSWDDDSSICSTRDSCTVDRKSSSTLVWSSPTTECSRDKQLTVV